MAAWCGRSSEQTSDGPTCIRFERSTSGWSRGLVSARLVSPSDCFSARLGKRLPLSPSRCRRWYMVVRFRIGTLLIAIALVALFVGFFAPELRSLDRNTRVIFAVVGIITALFVV